MTPEELSQIVVDALRALVDRGAVALPDGAPTDVTVERPRKAHGDYATNVALRLAKPAGRPPREVAELHRRARCSRPTASPASTSPGPAS